MKVLGIETSCDDTAAAVYDSAGGLRGHREASQLDSHRPFGGVVPELAARDHVRLLMPLVRQVLVDTDLKVDDLDGVAYTSGPGLAGALLVGAALGRSLAWSLDIPAAGIHHMEGHLLAPMLEADPPEFPFLALLVSGGHTMLVDVRAVGVISYSVARGTMRWVGRSTKLQNCWGWIIRVVLLWPLRP